MSALLRPSTVLRLLLLVLFVQLLLLLLHRGPWGQPGGRDGRCGWLADAWAGAKRWWYRRVVLREPRYSGVLSEGERRVYRDYVRDSGDGDPITDFEYRYPGPDAFAYIWYAVGATQICSALTAMTLLRSQYRLLNQSHTLFDGESGNNYTIDFLLLFVHNGDRPVGGGEDDEEEDDDDEEADREYRASERLVTEWERRGGLAEEVVIKNRGMWRHKSLLQNRVKYHSLRIPGYTRFVLLDPMGVALRPMNHLFNQNAARNGPISPLSVFAAPRADPREQRLWDTVMRPEKPVPCFGRRSPVVSTHLLAFLPGALGIKRILPALGIDNMTVIRLHQSSKIPSNDFQAINQEFSCNDEIEALDSKYSVADCNFLKVHKEPQDPAVPFSEVHFVHFSMDHKPWQDSYLTRVVPHLDRGMAKLILRWRKLAAKVCQFRQEASWFKTSLGDAGLWQYRFDEALQGNWKRERRKRPKKNRRH